ncbi:MAG: Panacea domain-containing protein [Acidimicrobiales bacterium]
MKLQKLVYYAQAWHLVWDEERLFPEPIRAWANGPVVYELFDAHRGSFSVSPPWKQGDPDALTTDEKETVDVVLESYGPMSGRQLSHLTHAERPWREARRGLAPTDRSNNEITQESLFEYYSALETSDDAVPIDTLAWDE